MNGGESPMNVAIRCDASHAIGTGHVMRCLTLADQLHERGAEVTFLCREHDGNINDYIAQRGYEVIRLPHAHSKYECHPREGEGPSSFDSSSSEYARWLAVPIEIDARETVAALRERAGAVDWLIVDHYGLDERWEQGMRTLTRRIMAIDDLANRRHDCDLLLDQGHYPYQLQRYRNLVPPTCRALLGPEYALLRPEFLRGRAGLRHRDGVVRRILLFFGGVDPTNETAKAICALQPLCRDDLLVDVVVGGANQHHESIRPMCDRQPAMSYHRNVNNMAEMMARADLAIGGGGATTWERCYLGLPSVVLVMAENQRFMVEALAAEGALINAGWYADLSVRDLTTLISSLLEQPRLLQSIIRATLSIMGDRDTQAAQPVAKTMLEFVHAQA